LIEDVLPMYTVEKKGFRKFVQRLGNRIKIRCRRFFTKKVNSLFVEGKKKLIEALSNAKYACTTADCWTSRRKSFIGVTVHWLDFKMKVNILLNISSAHINKLLTISPIEEECLPCSS
jgi:hypothetical protein